MTGGRDYGSLARHVFRAPCGASSPERRLFMDEGKVTVFARIGFFLEIDAAEAAKLREDYGRFSGIDDDLALRFVTDGRMATSAEGMDVHYVPDWNN